MPSAFKRGVATLAVGVCLGAAAPARAGAVLPVAGEIGQGTAFAQRGSYLAAELFLKRAIAVDGKVRGPDHPGLAVTLDKLATLYQATGRHGAAEPLLKRAVAIDEKALGPEHPDLAGRLNNLAVLYWATGRPAAAEPLFVRALAILEKRLPPGHPVLAAIRENYVGCLGALGREKAAAARGQRPPVEDHGPWPEAAERERHGGPSTPAPPGPGPRGAGPVVLAARMGPPSEGAGRQIAFTSAPPSRYERIDLPGFPAEAEKAVQETND